MNKPFKINRNDYMNIYWASDFHYNHQPEFIWKPRGFTSYKAHDQFIETEIDKLTHDDLLIYLGDFSLNTTDEATSKLLHRIKAQMFYVFGNHEGYHSRFYRNSLEEFLKKATRINSWGEDTRLFEDYSDESFQIFPFNVDKTTKAGMPGKAKKVQNKHVNAITYFGEDATFHIGNTLAYVRHMAPLIWDKMKYDNYVAVCGHSHGNLPMGTPFTTNEGRILDISMDNAIKYNGSAFFKQEELVQIMSYKKGKTYDHHGSALHGDD